MLCDEAESQKNVWITGVELGLLLQLCSFGVIYFRAPEVSWPITSLVLLSWWLGFSGTILLAADLAEASGPCRSLTPPIWLEKSWAVVYWTTFALAWVILPMVRDYCLSGEFTSRARFLSALRLNLRFALGVLVLAAFFIGYLVVSGSMELQAIFGLAIALGNTYGLLVVILLMGNGFIEIPRWLWVSSFPQRELDILFFRATEADSNLYDAFYALKDAEEELESYENEPSLTMEYSMVKATCNAFDMASNAPSGAFPLADSGANPPSHSRGQESGYMMFDVRKLADIHLQIKRNQETLIACRQRWNTLVRRVELVTGVTGGDLPYPRRMDERFLWLWYTKLEHTFMRYCSILMWILSVLMVWSEVTIIFKWDMSPFGKLLSVVAKMNSPLATQAVIMVPFLYMNFCCFRTLFKMHFFGNFALSGPHHSHTGPLLFNGQYLVRLQFALGYNFLTILRHGTSSRPTAFRDLMSSMEVVPILGAQFNIYTPVIIVVLCAFTLWYSRILRLVGFEHEDLLSYKDSAGYERLEEGRRTVERERRRSHLRGLWDDEEISISDIEIPELRNSLDHSNAHEDK